MPKDFYDYRTNKYESNDDEETTESKRFNLSILADKKPYFMTYIYPQARMEYKTFIEASNKKCLNIFGMELQELQASEDRTPEQEEFLYWYNYKMPVGISPCIMNKIAWRIESEFDKTYKEDIYGTFDYSILKSGVEYSKSSFYSIKKVYQDYNKRLGEFIIRTKKERVEKFQAMLMMNIMKEDFTRRVYQINSNRQEVCDILLDICYKTNKSKQFVWDVCGDTIVENLLVKNNNSFSIPIKDEEGDIAYNGHKFTIKTMEVE